jgi:hypothetical protein
MTANTAIWITAAGTGNHVHNNVAEVFNIAPGNLANNNTVASACPRRNADVFPDGVGPMVVSDHERSTVDVNRLSGDVARIRPAQEPGGRCDFVRASTPSGQRHVNGVMRGRPTAG